MPALATTPTPRKSDATGARRQKVLDQVSIAIARESESRIHVDEEPADEAMEERLDEDEAYMELTARPLREVVGQMCADIGLTVDWNRLAA